MRTEVHPALGVWFATEDLGILEVAMCMAPHLASHGLLLLLYFEALTDVSVAVSISRGQALCSRRGGFIAY